MVIIKGIRVPSRFLDSMAVTQAQALLTEATVREVDNTFKSRIEAQNERIDKNIADLLQAIRLLANSKGNNSIPEDRVSYRTSPTPVIHTSDSNRDAESEISSPSLLKEPVARETEEAFRSTLNLTSKISKSKLIPMKYSCEESHARITNGLCVFCDERDSPYHQLKHKRLRIVMMDFEDASMAGVEEKESLPESVIASHTVTNAVPQSQVTYVLEHSLRICSRPLGVNEDLPYTYATVGNDQVQFQSGFECINGKDSAHQVFDIMLLRKYRLQQRRN